MVVDANHMTVLDPSGGEAAVFGAAQLAIDASRAQAVDGAFQRAQVVQH
jgi:hypothetical protein